VILAGDVGGTNTRLALFEVGVRDPVALAIRPSRSHDGLASLVQAFIAQHPTRLAAASFGVAGPVHGGRTTAVNLAWAVDAAALAHDLGLRSVGLINDLEANAYGLAALRPDEFAVLNAGDPDARGNAAVISAGTGLGQAGLFWDGERHHPFATEGGHADFAPRDELQNGLYRWLAASREHVSYERVVSGMGLVSIYGYLRERSGEAEPAWLTDELAGDGAAAICRAGVEERSAICAQALDLFVGIYGSQAGNVALTLNAAGGVYLGGGIAPRIVPVLRAGGFMRAFTAKGRLSPLLERICVRVVLNDHTALLGAARHAELALSQSGSSAP
jgi:glucokinase